MSAILGVSGLAESVRFKRAHWPALDEREYRILQGFDAAAALVVDGEVVGCGGGRAVQSQQADGRFSGPGDRLLPRAGGVVVERSRRNSALLRLRAVR